MKVKIVLRKSISICRCFLLLFCACLLMVSTTLQAKSQDKAVIGFDNASLPQVFQKIETAFQVKFFYNPAIINQKEKISLAKKERALPDLLEALEGKTDLKFKQVGNMIGVQIAPKVASPVRESFIITGRVTNSSGSPLIGVTVRNKNTKNGTVTDQNGSYNLRASDGDELEFSYIGYDTKTIKVSTDHLDVVLAQNNNTLNEAVVVGYGSIMKKDLTGSVATISGKEIQNVPFTTVDNALAGKVAGLQITKDDGTPGGAVRIRLRGSTSFLGGNMPLFVIDGVPVELQSNYITPGYDVSNPVGNNVTGQGGVSAGMSTAFVNGLNSLSGLNIEDIASITVLKDASATAIYGSKAANGVIIITTKRGEKDMKPQITFNYYSTYTTPVLPKLLNGPQYRTLLTEAAKNDFDYLQSTNQPVNPLDSAILFRPDSYFGTGNTNWLKLVTAPTVSHNADISIRGGSAASTYYTSINFNSTPGVVKGSNYQQVSGKLNMENEIGNHFKFITNVDLGYTSQDITNGAYTQALQAPPTYKPYDSTGNFTSFSQVGYSYFGFLNPVALLTAINNSKAFSLLGSLSAIYDFTPALQFKSTVSLNMQNYNQRNFTPSYLAIGSFDGNITNNGGIGSNSNSQFDDWFLENTLTYNKKFNENHSLNILVGTSYETTKRSFFSATASGYPNNNVLNSLSSAVLPLITQGDNPSIPQSYLVSFYTRANYVWRNKYLFTFTGRADGSSKFGPQNKFGYFPSGGVAWRISQENFLKNVSWIDEIKLRGSYGLTGTQNIGDQMYRTLYNPYSYAGTSALVPTQLGNPAIKWEATKQTDAGIDFSFFNGRLQGTADYYKKITDGALLNLPVAPSSSYSSLLLNVADIKNTGYEISLQGTILQARNFSWKASINITWDKSLVTKLDPNADLGQLQDLTNLEYQNTTLVQGKPLGLITGMEVTGIIKTQKELNDYKSKLPSWAVNSFFGYLSLGDPMFKLDSTGYPAFNQIIANAAPKYYGGFTQEFTWKNFDLDFYFTFSEGGKLMWGDDVSSLNFVGVSNANAVMLKRWTPQNPNSNQPRLLLNDEVLLSNTNLSVFNSSYVKLRTITLNYQFSPTAWMKRTGIANASVFASATNVFTLTHYPGNNPETSDDPYSVAGGYFDVSSYPTVKTVSLGLKISF